MQERRISPRWQINQKASFRLEGAFADAVCQIIDINFKGIQIALNIKLDLDSYINFRLSCSEDFTLLAQAWVVWHKRTEERNVYGLYFTKLKDADKEKIYKFVYRNTPENIAKGWWNDSTEMKGGEKMDDRRIFQRFNLKLPVRLLDVNSGYEIPAETIDVSAKGLGLRLKQELRANTPLEAWVHMPDQGEPLYTRGVTVWSRQDASGDYRVGMDLEKADLMGLSRNLRA